MKIHFLRSRLRLDAATVRLTLTYLAIIMVMSIGFSVIFYHTSSVQLDRPLSPERGAQIRGEYGSTADFDARRLSRNLLEDLLRERAQEGREALIARLLLVNALAALAGIGISYALARRSLWPIEQTIEAQNQFVGDVSHELRTPLTALLATNEVTLRQTKITAADARELIRHNVEEVQKLHRLTNSMLDLLRQNDDSLQMQVVTVQDAVRDAINSVVQLAINKRIRIDDSGIKHAVLADPIALSRIITILLDNAIKYSPAKSVITVTSHRHGKHVRIQVKDQGAGIDPQDLPHIFTRLYRADKSRGTSSVNGYGLGLAIAQQLVTRMHGTIAADSVPGNGSTFTVSLLPAKVTQQ